jgi:hypothetical protein
VNGTQAGATKNCGQINFPTGFFLIDREYLGTYENN